MLTAIGKRTCHSEPSRLGDDYIKSFFLTEERVSFEYRNGIRKYEPLEQPDAKTGLPFCKVCKQSHYRKVVTTDGEGKSVEFIVRQDCDCSPEMQERKAIEEAQQEWTARKAFEKGQLETMLPKRYAKADFDTATITRNNSGIYAACRRYVEKADKMLEECTGLYLHGENSTGKTHLAACICNRLIKKGYSCLWTSGGTMLSAMSASYNGESGLSALLRKFKNSDFVFWDDLGKEFISREREVGKGKAGWAETQIVELINDRYNSMLPVIFTSNYTIEGLHKRLNLDTALVERVNEMSTAKILVKGDNFRAKGGTYG